MTTHFITAEIDLESSPAALNVAIQSELQSRGEPLRWAITAVEEGIATLEAVVTTEP
jgi:hypothetical protein